MKKQHTLSLGAIIMLVILYFLIKPNLSSNPPANNPTTQSNQSATTAPGSGKTNNSGNSSSGSGDVASNWGVQKKTSGCVINGKFPDIGCTPGAIIASATKDQICQSGYSATVRNVTESDKDQVYAEYGIKSHTPGQYEVDHFISLELGGANDIANLWPEAAAPQPGFHEKDKVENYLHEQVCSGAMTLLEAQTKISSNWLDVYNNMPNK